MIDAAGLQGPPIWLVVCVVGPFFGGKFGGRFGWNQAAAYRGWLTGRQAEGLQACMSASVSVFLLSCFGCLSFCLSVCLLIYMFKSSKANQSE